MTIQHYTPSSHRRVSTDIIHAGTSNDNIKILQLGKLYKNPIYKEKFKIADYDYSNLSVTKIKNTIKGIY